MKEFPRVPFAQDFHTFSDSGEQLSCLHLGYETCEEYPLQTRKRQTGVLKIEHFRIGKQAMKFSDNGTTLDINEYIQLTKIPDAAHQYLINGQSPLKWLIDRYQITQDKHSGIVNDPNDWFDNPQDLIAAIRRIVHVSVETMRIVRELPGAMTESDGPQ